MIKLAAPPALALFALSCAAPPPSPPPPGPDQCGAVQMQYLVGRNRSQIPPEPAGATWRVTCTECPITMDFNPRRLNIFYDQQSGEIREVKCG